MLDALVQVVDDLQHVRTNARILQPSGYIQSVPMPYTKDGATKWLTFLGYVLAENTEFGSYWHLPGESPEKGA